MAHTRRFNFRSEADSVLNLDSSTIPNLSPKNAIDLFMEGDSSPYFKIQAIKYPAKANGWDYVESFWDSYLSKIARAPIPGSRSGHNMSYGARGPTDLVVIGGRIDKNGDGTGTVFLKNYIPPVGESGDNSIFIKANKAGMVDYSIVSYTRDIITTSPNGEPIRQCVESLAGERNDCVDYGTGAMDMKTNAQSMTINDPGFTNAKTLIKAGKIDSVSKWSFSAEDGDSILGDDDWEKYSKWFLAVDESATEQTKERFKYPFGKNGKVYRSALRAIASRAAQADFQDLSDLASELLDSLDKKKNQEKHMDKHEVLTAIATLKTNGELTLAECAKAMGLESQIKTDADVAIIAKMNSLTVVLGEGDPVAKVNALNETAKANAAAAREQAITALVGPKENEDKTENKRYIYVQKITAGLEGEKFNSAIAGLKDDSILKALSGEAADVDSDVNVIASTRKVNVSEEYNSAAVTL